MSVIALEGMQFYAHHGFYEEEQIIGNDYVVDVYITTTTNRAAIEDDLYQTINYETVYRICASAMRKRSKLIEAVAERIGMGLRFQFRMIEELKIRVRKMNPPLGGHVDSAYIEIDANYSKRCGRCSRPLLCYGDNNCWCMDTKVYGKMLEHVKEQFGNNCLCKECLDYFAG